MTNVNAATSTANLTLTPGTGGSSTTTGSATTHKSYGWSKHSQYKFRARQYNASGGTNNVNTGGGDDTMTLLVALIL